MLENRDHSSLAEEAKAYLAQSNAGKPPSAAAFSIACPIEGDRVALTNFDWSFSIEELRRELAVDRRWDRKCRPVALRWPAAKR